MWVGHGDHSRLLPSDLWDPEDPLHLEDQEDHEAQGSQGHQQFQERPVSVSRRNVSREDEEDLSRPEDTARDSTYSGSFGSGNAVGSWVTLVRRWYCCEIYSKEPTQPSCPPGPNLGVRDKCCHFSNIPAASGGLWAEGDRSGGQWEVPGQQEGLVVGPQCTQVGPQHMHSGGPRPQTSELTEAPAGPGDPGLPGSPRGP